MVTRHVALFAILTMYVAPLQAEDSSCLNAFEQDQSSLLQRGHLAAHSANNSQGVKTDWESNLLHDSENPLLEATMKKVTPNKNVEGQAPSADVVDARKKYAAAMEALDKDLVKDGDDKINPLFKFSVKQKPNKEADGKAPSALVVARKNHAARTDSMDKDLVKNGNDKTTNAAVKPKTNVEKEAPLAALAAKKKHAAHMDSNEKKNLPFKSSVKARKETDWENNLLHDTGNPLLEATLKKIKPNKNVDGRKPPAALVAARKKYAAQVEATDKDLVKDGNDKTNPLFKFSIKQK